MSVVASNRKSMHYNINIISAKPTTVTVSPKFRARSPCESSTVPSYRESPVKGHTLMGKRFPRAGKDKLKLKLRNVKVVHENEARSHSVDRGSHPKEIKRGRSTQSLFLDNKDNQKGNKFVRGLKAIGFSSKNKFLRKNPFKNKFNSDSSTVEGSESEIDSLSDWSQLDSRVEESNKGKEKYHRTYSDSSYYGLDRVLEVKESTITPPGSPILGKIEMKIRDKVFVGNYDRQSLSSGDSTSSDSSSDEDSSSESSTKGTNPLYLPSVRRVSCRRITYKGASPKLGYQEKAINEKQEDFLVLKTGGAEAPKNSFPIPVHDTTDAFTTSSDLKNLAETFTVGSETKLDVACPKISVVSYDQEVSASSPTPLHSSNATSPLYKSKSATALNGYALHECESTLSSVLIAPDYKEHGPCLIPSSRNDGDTAERIISSETTNTTAPGVNQHPPAPSKSSHSPAKVNSVPCIHRRSSDSDLSITPKGNCFFHIFHISLSISIPKNWLCIKSSFGKPKSLRASVDQS